MENKLIRQVSEFNSELKLNGFTVFQAETDGGTTSTYRSKDFYEICVTTGINCANGTYEKDSTIKYFGFRTSLCYFVMSYAISLRMVKNLTKPSKENQKQWIKEFSNH
ncbi:MAG: hypothetical protein KDC49_20105 [Saprospiraceae bacterium]|nr:hypothetical protein [Saprospiraceae bacterium]